jgi:hypothetical protein
MLKSKHTSICKDPYANEAIYKGVEFTMTGLKFVNAHGLGDFKIPYVYNQVETEALLLIFYFHWIHLCESGRTSRLHYCERSGRRKSR